MVSGIVGQDDVNITYVTNRTKNMCDIRLAIEGNVLKPFRSRYGTNFSFNYDRFVLHDRC